MCMLVINFCLQVIIKYLVCHANTWQLSPDPDVSMKEGKGRESSKTLASRQVCHL